MDGSVAAFVGVSLVVIVTPGQDTALTIRNTLLGGRRAGVFTSVGVAAGQLVWTVAASAGLMALLVASEPVFGAIRLAGAAYLVWLGATTVWAAVRGPGTQDVPGRRGPVAAHSPRHAFRQGFLSNLGNPKMVIFFSSLLPQFVPIGGAPFVSMLGLGLVFCTMTLSWLAAYTWLVAKAGPLFRRPAVRRAFDAATGLILVAFGLRLAAEPVVIER